MAGARGKESWGTRMGVIMAVMGSAVGLGNFLRFPGLAAKYEGGAFMIPYFVALLLLGLPLAWAEWAMGRYGGERGFNSTPGIYRAIWPNRLAPYVGGILGLIIPVGIFMYYVLIEAWCFGYAIYYLTGQMAELGRQARLATGGLNEQTYIDFFAAYSGKGQDGILLSSQGWPTLLSLLACFVFNYILIFRGLSKGIEKFCLWAMPALIVCALLVLLRVLTLPNVEQGLGFMWNPRTQNVGLLKALSNPQMWLEATSQIFFTLSVGFGIVITYASYLKRNDDIALSSLTSCAGNEFCEVALGGLITIPAAFIFLGAAHVTQVADSSFNLGFKTLPMVFESMPFGYVAGFLFFFLLFLAAITSSISMLQPAIALLEEGLGIGRRASVTFLAFITGVGALFVVYFSKGLAALDTFDFWAGTFCMFLMAIVQTLVFGWVLGLDRGFEEIDRGAAIRVPRVVGFVLKYISPLYLLTVFGFWAYQNLVSEKDNRFLAIRENRSVGWSVLFLGMVAVFFALLISLAVKRWRIVEMRAAGQEVAP